MQKTIWVKAALTYFIFAWMNIRISSKYHIIYWFIVSGLSNPYYIILYKFSGNILQAVTMDKLAAVDLLQQQLRTLLTGFCQSDAKAIVIHRRTLGFWKLVFTYKPQLDLRIRVLLNAKLQPSTFRICVSLIPIILFGNCYVTWYK